MKKITELLDSDSWIKHHFNPIEYLYKLKKTREELFFGTALKSIKLNSPVALSQVREALRSNQVYSIIWCFCAEPAELQVYRTYIRQLRYLCLDEELNDEDKICILNISFAEYYTKGETKNKS